MTTIVAGDTGYPELEAFAATLASPSDSDYQPACAPSSRRVRAGPSTTCVVPQRLRSCRFDPGASTVQPLLAEIS